MKAFSQFVRQAVAKANALKQPQQTPAPAPTPEEILAGDRQAARQAVEELPVGEALALLRMLADKHPRASDIQLLFGRVLLRRDPLDMQDIQSLAGIARFLPRRDREQLEAKLAPHLRAHLDSSEEEIHIAERTAALFADYAGDLRGIARTLGIAAFRLGGPDAVNMAANYFGRELTLDPGDEESAEGRRLALLKSGRYEALTFAAGADDGTLSILQKAMRWVDGEPETPEPPTTAATLEELRLDASMEWERMFCAARLRLIEGDCHRAAELLNAVADNKPEDSRVAYYGCWADLLCHGDENTLDAWVEDYQEWRGAWALVSRLWDHNPAALNQTHAGIISRTDADFAQLLQARRAISLDDEPIVAPLRPAGTLEEEIEAFRIRLGQAFLRQDLVTVEQRMERPIFRLLPKADRLFWEGMRERLRGAIDSSRELFEKASGLGHRRAAWAVSVWHAEAGDIPQAMIWSRAGLEHRGDERGKLWRLWLDTSSGNASAADSLSDAVGTESKRLSRAGAYLAVAKADRICRTGEVSEASVLMERASAAFHRDRQSRAGSTGEALMAACLQFWLNPQRGAPALSSQWSSVIALPPTPRRSWLLWMVILAKLARKDPRDIPQAAAELRRLLRSAEVLTDTARNSLVRALAGSLGESSGTQASEPWLETLRELPGGSLEGEKQLAVAVAAWRYCHHANWTDPALADGFEQQSGADPANVSLALIAAFAQAARGQPGKAAALLDNSAQAASCAWLSGVAEGLAGRNDGEALARLNLPSLELASASGLLLQAVGMFRNSERERGFESVLAAWRVAPARVPGIFRVSQWVPVICAASIGNTPPQLLATIKELGQAASEALELDRLAHCAAALNSQTVALELWRRAVAAAAGETKPDWTDFARYLCHLASVDAKAGRAKQGLAWVREACALLPATELEIKAA